jgi:PST family polysaccharide transporter
MRRDANLLRRAFVLRGDGLGGKVVSGAGFQFVGVGLRTVITIASTAILARLLTPADFGYVAMATVVTEFAALLGTFGFSNILIQRRAINRLQMDTVFWASLAVGTVLGLAVFAASFCAELLFPDPNVGPLLRGLCLPFLLNSLYVVPWVVLSRLMRFRTEFFINIGAALFRTGVAVACAVAGLGAWSLVIGAIAGAACSTALYYLAVPYFPRWRFFPALLVSTWRTSSSYFGNGILSYTYLNLDLLLIGRQLGATPLGYYQTARSLTDEIRARIAIPIHHVMFPAFSALQADKTRFQELVLRAGRLLAAVVIPVGVGVAANAAELVLVLYGAQWEPMIPVMAMFGLSGGLRASTAIASPLFNANDRVALAFRYNLIAAMLLIGGVMLAMPYGIDMVAAAVAVASLYSLVIMRAACGLIGLKTRHVLQMLGPPALASFVMWLTTAALRQIGWSTQPLLLLPAHVIAGGCVYVAVLHLLSRQYLRDFRHAATLFFKRSRHFES